MEQDNDKFLTLIQVLSGGIKKEGKFTKRLLKEISRASAIDKSYHIATGKFCCQGT